MAKKKPSPEELDEIRAMLADVRRDVRQLIEVLQARLGQRPA
jgi:hypothetical protein